METERGKTGTGGRGRVRGAGGIKGVARQRAVSTASPSEARMGRRGSDAALSEGRTARRAGLVNAHRWKEGRKRTATGDALNAAFRLNRENRVCLEADADSLLLHFVLFPFVSVDLRFDFPRSRRAPPGVAAGSPFQGTPRAVSSRRSTPAKIESLADTS